MKEKTIFPREEKSEVLFDKILNDPWAYNKLFQTFCNNLFCNDDSETILSPLQFTEALFNCYSNKDLSAFLMAITQNTMFDLLRNSFLIPYRFNADGKPNPIIMTDDKGMLLPEFADSVHEKDYQHFYNIYKNLDNNKNMFLAEAYRYSHTYGDDPSVVEQQVLERSTGILLIRELPDTVRMKETEAEAYSAVWDLMLELEKNLPMAYIFYGQDSFVEHNELYSTVTFSPKTRCQDSFVEHNEHFDELGIFLPNSIFLRNLEHHVKKAEAIIYAKD